VGSILFLLAKSAPRSPGMHPTPAFKLARLCTVLRSLAGKSIGNEAAELVGQMLVANHTLISLDLSGNMLMTAVRTTHSRTVSLSVVLLRCTYAQVGANHSHLIQIRHGQLRTCIMLLACSGMLRVPSRCCLGNRTLVRRPTACGTVCGRAFRALREAC
jgi:hypothetical protein